VYLLKRFLLEQSTLNENGSITAKSNSDISSNSSQLLMILIQLIEAKIIKTVMAHYSSYKI
jgi:hypothetical protein